ncbi:hypothetical protein CKG00_03120 [Morganella morganii]|uniref:Uncharacterized protein n=1 Tax=Morganella morganii TaxID=582 RepID=A0A433ZTN7_MORMO|nr:hypothetical protein CKG00_03120 [Morganella morganii]
MKYKMNFPVIFCINYINNCIFTKNTVYYFIKIICIILQRYQTTPFYCADSNHIFILPDKLTL